MGTVEWLTQFCFKILIYYFYRALKDADKAVHLAPDWPKGYFRKGRALAGLKVSTAIYMKH